MINERRSVLPFIVGITGKRDLGDRSEAVRAELRRLFDLLDERCPHTDKIVLTGLAEGTDTLAAEEALKRAHWRVVAKLPLESQLYREDFKEADARRLDKLLAHGSVHVAPLPPLRSVAGGGPIPVESLHRLPAPGNAERRAHYEQLGLYLARYCGLLLGVTSKSAEAERLGGTDRVIRHRLDAARDEPALDVIARSDELCEDLPLDRFGTGPVWQVATERLDLPVGERLLVGTPSGQAAGNPDRYERSLAAADWIENFNRGASRLTRSDWQKVQKREGQGGTDAGAALYRIRLVMSAIQQQMMGRLRMSVRLLAMLFCFAVLSYELFIELKPYAWSKSMSGAYFAAVLTAVLVYWYARRLGWQGVAEEYRAVMEAARVQLAWWAAGLAGPCDRVDRLYLKGAHSSLAIVREALGQVLNAALLGGDPPRSRDDAVAAWIRTQLDYFTIHVAARRDAVHRTEARSWFLFAASIGAAACLAAMQTPIGRPLLELAEGHLHTAVRACVVIAALGAASLLYYASRRYHAFIEADGWSSTDAWKRLATRSGALFAGVVVAVGMSALAGLLPAPGEGGHGGPGFYREMAVDLVAIAVILPAAVAGAIRFAAEKSSLIPESHSYEESLERFQRAEAALSAAQSSDQVRSLAKAVGIEALRESEAWLRARRERPLEPVVGG
jgi:hypothetical protein